MTQKLAPITETEAAMLAERLTYGLGQMAYVKAHTPGTDATDYLQKELDQNLIQDADPNADFPNLDEGPAMARNLETILASKRACSALNKYAVAASICAPNEYELRALAESSVISALLMSAA